jgi:histone chaperone ASF1
MSVVSLLGVNVLNNPAKFGDKYNFEITFECLEPLQKGESIRLPWKAQQRRILTFAFTDLEWKLTYVGSATSYVPWFDLIQTVSRTTHSRTHALLHQRDIWIL